MSCPEQEKVLTEKILKYERNKDAQKKLFNHTKIHQQKPPGFQRRLCK